MRLQVAVDDRRLRVVAHPRRPQQMPPRRAHGHLLVQLARARGAQRLRGAIGVEAQHAPRVLRDRVLHARRRQPVGVRERVVEHDAVGLVGQVLGEDAPAHRPPHEPAHPLGMSLAPPGPALERDADGAGDAAEAPLGAAHEPARRVGLVELVGDDLRPGVPHPRRQRLVERARDRRERMHHEPAADEPGAVGQPREQQQPRRADPVRREHDDRRVHDVRPAVAVDVLHAARAPARVDDDPRGPGPGPQVRAARDRPPPVRQVGRGLRARGAALQARAPLHACRRGDRVRPRPPVPAEVVVRAGHQPPATPDRQRRMRERGRGRQRGVAGQAARAELDVGAVEVGREVAVGDRPVVGDAVERPHPEVRRAQPAPVGVVEDRAAADAGEHERRDLRPVDGDRVVGLGAADVGVRRPRRAHRHLVARPRAREVRRVVPVALLEADDAHPCGDEPRREDAARRAGADDDDVGRRLRPRRDRPRRPRRQPPRPAAAPTSPHATSRCRTDRRPRASRGRRR